MTSKNEDYGTWGEPQSLPKIPGGPLKRWQRLTLQLSKVADSHDWSMAQAAKDSNIPKSTLNEWYHGTYAGNYEDVSTRVEAFLSGLMASADETATQSGVIFASHNNSDFEPWETPKHTPELDDKALKRWRVLTAKVKEKADRYRWSKSEVYRRSGVALGTLSQWYDGNYKGKIENISDRIEQWLASVDEFEAAAAGVPAAPGFVTTPTAAELTDTLLYAQMMPEMVVVTLGAGMGKTMTAQAYRDARPHCYLITMRPSTKSVFGMLQEFARELDINERNPARLDSTIGETLRRNGRNTLLIVDEAQNLQDDAVNQMRHLLDVYGVGIAMLGNEELYGRFGGGKANPAYAQINRRIGKRLRRLHPLKEDIEALIDAWKVTDPGCREVLRAIGTKPGALSQISKTMQLAGMLASGEDREVSAEHIKAAWENRGADG